jgi:hypothetical protein
MGHHGHEPGRGRSVAAEALRMVSHPAGRPHAPLVLLLSRGARSRKCHHGTQPPPRRPTARRCRADHLFRGSWSRLWAFTPSQVARRAARLRMGQGRAAVRVIRHYGTRFLIVAKHPQVLPGGALAYAV